MKTPSISLPPRPHAAAAATVGSWPNGSVRTAPCACGPETQRRPRSVWTRDTAPSSQCGPETQRRPRSVWTTDTAPSSRCGPETQRRPRSVDQRHSAVLTVWTRDTVPSSQCGPETQRRPHSAVLTVWTRDTAPSSQCGPETQRRPHSAVLAVWSTHATLSPHILKKLLAVHAPLHRLCTWWLCMVL